MDGPTAPVIIDRRAPTHEQQTLAQTVADLAFWAWGGKGQVGVDETLRDVATALVEQKDRDRLLRLYIIGGIVLANPLTAHIAEPWLRTFGVGK